MNIPNLVRFKRSLNESAWLPSRGNVLFTLLTLGCFFYALRVGAISPSAVPTTSASTIAYQGRLADAAGNPLTGTYDMTFRLYNVATGGSDLWTESWAGLQVDGGLFNVLLGSESTITPDILTDNPTLWLGITVGSDSEMIPRIQLGSAPFAMTVADGAVTTAKIADGAVTSEKLSPETRTLVWSTTENGGVTSSLLPYPMAVLTITVDVPSQIMLTVAGTYNSSTADWTWFNIDRNGVQIQGGGVGSPPGVSETFSLVTMDYVAAGTYIYKAQIAPTGSSHPVSYDHTSFIAIAFPPP